MFSAANELTQPAKGIIFSNCTAITFQSVCRLVVTMMMFNSLMVCIVHVLAAPTPTTFSAATDTLS